MCSIGVKIPNTQAAPNRFAFSSWFARFLDFFIVPYLIVVFAYEPNFASGFEDYFESGQYLSVINGIFHGQIIYKDIFLLFGPLTYFGPVAAMTLFGKNLAVLRGFFLVTDITALLMVYVICRVLIQNRFFSYLASFLSVIEAHHPFWSTRWGGFRFVTAYIAILGILLFCAKKKKRYLFLAGVFSALAWLHSFEMGLFCYIAFLFFFVFYKTWGARQEAAFVPEILSYLGGSVFIFLPFIVYLIMHNAFLPWLKDLMSLGARKALLGHFELNEKNLLKIFFPGVIYFFSATFSITQHKKNKNLKAAMLLSLSSFGFAFYLGSFRVSNGIIDPHFMVIVPFSLIILFYLVENIFNYLVETWRLGFRFNPKTVFLSLAFVLAVGYAIFSEKSNWGKSPTAFQRWSKYQRLKDKIYPLYSGFDEASLRHVASSIERLKGSKLPEWQADEIETISSYVTENTNKDDYLLAFPEMDFFNFVLDLPEVSRFYICGYAEMKPAWRLELLQNIRKKKPKIVLVRNHLSNLARALNRDHELLPEVSDFIVKNYKKTIETDGLTIYSLKELDPI